MDDFLILDYDKRRLREFKFEIQEFLSHKLKLELHPKKANVYPADKGIDFLGYINFENYRLLRKSTVKRFIKRTKKGFDNNSVWSWLNYAKFSNSWRLRKNLGEKLSQIKKIKICLIK